MFKAARIRFWSAGLLWNLSASTRITTIKENFSFRDFLLFCDLILWDCQYEQNKWYHCYCQISWETKQPIYFFIEHPDHVQILWNEQDQWGESYLHSCTFTLQVFSSLPFTLRFFHPQRTQVFYFALLRVFSKCLCLCM